MLVDLLPDDFIEKLSGEPIDRWLDLTKAVIGAVEDAIIASNDIEYDTRLLVEATHLSAEAANALGLPKSLVGLAGGEHYYSDGRRAFEQLRSNYARARSERFAEKLAASLSDGSRLHETPRLALSNRTIVEVHNHLGDLRRSVSETDLEEKKKDGLEKLMDEFEALLNSKSPESSKILRSLAIVAGGVLGITSFLADAPAATETIGKITSILGQEIESADTVKRIEDKRSRKALPRPVKDRSETYPPNSPPSPSPPSSKRSSSCSTPRARKNRSAPITPPGPAMSSAS